MKSIDAGNSWNPLTTGEDSHLLGVSFTDPNTGTVVGKDGTILSTVDGGVVWFTQASGTAVSLNGVFFIDGQTGWAVGDNGTILHTMDGVSSVEETADLPSTLLLRQNYPNPFNGISNFEFDVSSPEDVKLSVFDVLGREVAIVVDERLPAGTYRRQWDAGSLPSGVYFYRVQAGTFAETRKLILLK